MAKKKKGNNQDGGKKRFQAHFRKFHDKVTTAHPQYVFDETGKTYKVLGITKSPKSKGVLNVKLQVNPEPNNKEAAYIRTKPQEIKKGVQNEKLKGWKFSSADKATVKKIIEDANKPKKKQ